MEYNFNGKRALVTGGSRGIGKEIVKKLINCGAEVFAIGKTQNNLDALKAEIPSVYTICVDVVDWNATLKAVEDIGDLDFLVNNAGAGPSTPFGEITEEQFDTLYSLNVKPVINISQIVVKRLMERRKSGCIVNISSVASQKDSLIAVYGSSKAALDHLTKILAIQLGPYGIRVNSVNPTLVNTDMSKLLLENPQLRELIKANIPLKKFCEVEDVANAVLFLLSEKARMINGAILPIDGGSWAL